MYSNSATLYPMLGVGAFMTMFWSGVVVGHELGLGCMSLLILGLLCGCVATVGVCELQRRDGEGRPADRPSARPTPAACDAGGGATPAPAGRAPARVCVSP